MASDLTVLAVLAVGVTAGALIDVRTRRVPNTLTLTLAVAGLAAAASGVSNMSLTMAIVGMLIGLLLMLPGHYIGATGAGDVKLFAASGALLGPAAIALAFVYTALAGGLLALAVAAKRRRLGATVESAGRLFASGAANVGDVEHPAANNRFAYAPAIAAGTIAAALGL